MRRDYEQARWYTEHRNEFNQFLLRSLIWMVYWTSVQIPAVGAAFILLLAGHERLGPKVVLEVALFLVISVGVLSSLQISRWLYRAIFTEYRVRSFPEYESKVRSTLEAQSEPDTK
jgi:hypothetical protein